MADPKDVGDHEPGQTGGRESWKGAAGENSDVQEHQSSGQSSQAKEAVAALKHFKAAVSEMGLNQQEQELYAHHLNNLYGERGFEHPDGSISTVFAETRGVDGRTYLIPRVHEGGIHSSDDAMELAQKNGLDRLPSYDSPDAAKARYDAMHAYMDRDVEDYLHQREAPDSELRRRYLSHRSEAVQRVDAQMKPLMER